MDQNQLYLIKSGENSFVETEGEATIGLSGGNIGFGTTHPEAFVHVTGDTQIDGDLTVKGNFTTVDSTTIQVDDKNIEIGVGATTDAAADGGGITLHGATNKTITWSDENDAWTSSEHVHTADGKHVATDQVRALDGDGLKLSDQNGTGLFVEDGGNVGIKTTNPTVALDVVGSGNFSASITAGTSIDAGTSVDAATTMSAGTSLTTPLVKAADANGLNLQDDDGNGIFIEDGGNVGIGTGDPAYTLDVVGSGNFSAGLYVDGNSVLTGSAADLGKWDEAADSKIYYNDGNVGVSTSDPVYTLDVVGSGNFSAGLYVDGNSVLTGSAADLGKWDEAADSKIYYNGGNVGIGTSDPDQPLHVDGVAYVTNGELNINNKFKVNTAGDVGGSPPAADDVIKWDNIGGRWIAGSSPGGGGVASTPAVPEAFSTTLSAGASIHPITFVDEYDVIPSIATDLEIADGPVIPYAISGLSETGYHAVFTKNIPTSNNYKIHTTFGGRDTYWETGVGGTSLIFDGSNGIFVDDITVTGNATVENGGLNIGNGTFQVASNGNVGGVSPVSVSDDYFIKWDNSNSKWIAATGAGGGGGGGGGGGVVADAFSTSLLSGNFIYPIDFGRTFSSIPSVATNVEVDDGDIIPFAVSGLSETGYHVVFSQTVPTDNNYTVHTVFGGGGSTADSFSTNLSAGSAIHPVEFTQAFASIPSISTDIEINDGQVIPYAISGLSTTGYYAVFTEDIPTDNNYKIHTVFGGSAGESAGYNEIAVTVAGGVFNIDGSAQLAIPLQRGLTYRFDQSDASNTDHPIKFSTTSDGTHSGGSEYTVGVTSVGTPGSDGAYTEIVLEQDTPDLYYYCGIHTGMGGSALGSIVLLAGGNVGIGTANPGSKLTLEDGDIKLQKTDSGNSKIIFSNTSDNTWAISGDADGDFTVERRVKATNIFINRALTIESVTAEAMRIDSAGNVGIGTTNPNLTGLQLGNALVVSSATGGEIVAHKSGSSVSVGDICGALLIANSDTDGVNDHFVGMWGKASSTNGSQSLHFAAGRSGYEGDAPHLTIDSTGNVGIGTSNPGTSDLVVLRTKGTQDSAWGCRIYCGVSVDTQQGSNRQLSVGTYRPATTDGYTATFGMSRENGTLNYLYHDNNGVLRTTTTAAQVGTESGTAIASQTSDERFKNIEDSFEYGLSHVLQLKPIAYKQVNDDTRRLGFGAQTTQSIVPESVFDTGDCVDGYDPDPENEGNQVPRSDDTRLGMEYVQLIPVLTKAIQEQQQIIEDLKSRIETLEQ